MEIDNRLRSAEAGRSDEELRDVQTTSEGVGPLLQRDYVAVIAGSACTPEEVVQVIRRDFPAFPPDELARFRRPEGASGPLEVGDTMQVTMPGVGDCAVLVTHMDARSMTVRTLEGHLEAGRNTFAAYYDDAGRLVARIRGRFRVNNALRLIGYSLFGHAAQANIWVTFLERVVAAVGGQVVGEVQVFTETVEETPADRGEEEGPTFQPPPA